MYHNWNPHNPTHFLSDNSCHHHCYRLTENWNMRSVRFWILKWTDAADWTIDYTTWYVGQVMKVPTRKLHGYQHETSPIQPNSTSYSTNNTLISWAPRIAERESPTTCCIAVRPPTSFFLPSFFLFFSLLSSFLIFFPSFFSVKCFLSFPFLFSFQNVSPSHSFHYQFSPALHFFSISPYYITNISIHSANHPLAHNPHPHPL